MRCPFCKLELRELREEEKHLIHNNFPKTKHYHCTEYACKHYFNGNKIVNSSLCKHVSRYMISYFVYDNEKHISRSYESFIIYNYYVIIDYFNKYSEISTIDNKKMSFSSTRIQKIIDADFSDLEKLKERVSMYVVFS